MAGKHILIVDDDQPLLIGLTARLNAQGYVITWATDAVSAISVALTGKPDLIILDLGLPAGDGFLVLARLKSLTPLAAIPVIVLSARSPLDNKKRALEAGAVGYFQKPPDNHEFLTAVRHAIGEASALSAFLET